MRSQRLFCKQLAYHLLGRWFLDRKFSEGTFDPSLFAKHYPRGLGAEVARVQSAQHVAPGNPAMPFGGEPRRNATHQSRTDPESVLDRKAQGQQARLGLGGPRLMDNRQGLGGDFTIHDPIAEPGPVVALRPIQAHQERPAGVRVKTVGADKAYHRKDFVAACRAQNIAPHVACKHGVSVPGLDGRTTTKKSYRVSQSIRKRVEEIFGWIRTVGGQRRSRYRGKDRTQAWGYFRYGTDPFFDGAWTSATTLPVPS